MKKRMCALIVLVLVTALGFCSCSDPEESLPEEVESVIIEQPEEIPEELPQEEVITTPEEKYKTLSDYETRPVAVMLNNLKIACPQSGISQAEIIYECIVEGSITRLLAVFPEYELLPTLGSVRSSRDYYVDLAQAHDAIYVHAGGSPMAYTVFKERNTERIDGVNGKKESHYFWRDASRRASAGLEHSMVIDGEGIAKAIETMGYRTETDADFEQPLKFALSDNDFAEKQDALDVSVPYSSYITARFEYDTETKLYKKYQFGKPHTDANTSEQLTYKNVIVLFVRHADVPNDSAGRKIVDFTGTGDGIFITNGKAQTITWEKEGRTVPYTLFAEGSELLLNPGKTYICIVPIGKEITLN